MPCGCSKQTVSGQYALVLPNGSKKQFNSQVEAKAAWIRGGKVGEVKPA